MPLLVLPLALIGVMLFSISVFTLVLTALIDSSLDQVVDVFHSIKIVLAWSFAGWLMLCMIALLWPGSKTANKFDKVGDDIYF